MNIIYGASIIGKIVLQNCKDRGINIDFFCDENQNKIGTFIDGIEVIHPSKIDKTSAHWIIAVINIESIVANTLQGCDWEGCLDYIDNFEIDSVFETNVVDMCKFAHRAFQTTDALLIRSVDLVITERCSLKCKDCANLMQYYGHPKHVDTELLYRSIDRICDIADEIQELRIIGGETFTNKNHHLILEKALSKNNINRIIVYTNGTINIPLDNLSYYQNPKVIIPISDYGILSKNLEKLVKTLDDYKIKYYVLKFDDWFDCGRIVPRRNINVFNQCCGQDLLTILYDKIYKCPFIAHGMNLQLLPNYEQDYLHIFTTNKTELKNFIENNVPESCYHCNGRIYGEEKIEPYIQLK